MKKQLRQSHNTVDVFRVLLQHAPLLPLCPTLTPPSGIKIDSTIDELVDAIDSIPLANFFAYFFFSPSWPLHTIFASIDNESYIDEFMCIAPFPHTAFL